MRAQGVGCLVLLATQVAALAFVPRPPTVRRVEISGRTELIVPLREGLDVTLLEAGAMEQDALVNEALEPESSGAAEDPRVRWQRHRLVRSIQGRRVQ